MTDRNALRPFMVACCVSGCVSSFSLPPAEPLRFRTEVEYIEVGRLIAAPENVTVPLGHGRSYWFNASDGSRWASDRPIVPPSTKVVILHEGLGIVKSGTGHVLRHVGGPRVVKHGWYGRVVEELPGDAELTEMGIEDGRRFEVTSASRAGTLPVPFEVLVSDDTTRIFVLESGAELVILRQLTNW